MCVCVGVCVCVCVCVCVNQIPVRIHTGFKDMSSNEAYSINRYNKKNTTVDVKCSAVPYSDLSTALVIWL